MLKTGKRIRRQRKFSEDFKLKVVKEYESGKLSIGEMAKIYITRPLSRPRISRHIFDS